MLLYTIQVSESFAEKTDSFTLFLENGVDKKSKE